MFGKERSFIISLRLSDSKEYLLNWVSGEIEDECTEIGSVVHNTDGLSS